MYLFMLICLIIMSISDAKEIHKCNCDVYLFNSTHRSELAVGFHEPNFIEVTKECNQDAVMKCSQICRKDVGEMTNNLDLEKIPKNKNRPIHVSLGQYLCNQVHHEVTESMVGLWAHMHCKVKQMEHGVPFDVEHNVHVFTGLESQKTMSCVHRRFIPGHRTGSTTTTTSETHTPITTPTTTPTPITTNSRPTADTKYPVVSELVSVRP